MTSEMLGQIDTRRTQPEVDKLLNVATSVGSIRPRPVYDGVRVQRPRGYKGSGDHVYDFGDTYSRPAVVENGLIRRL